MKKKKINFRKLEKLSERYGSPTRPTYKKTDHVKMILDSERLKNIF